MERNVKNLATPLYSSGLCPAITQSDAPPMMLFLDYVGSSPARKAAMAPVMVSV
ncbi:hypothetical protein P378_20095 [Desulforamulus profundi]|uniref:Uncharacterized protein n=1 Tax=Desulforamulus profundi TaxID=1383067 RepID=A0A2C6L1D5_9FIRM|nr:hypothetical protein P378_20095 [Desulforamulus profundi]